MIIVVGFVVDFVVAAAVDGVDQLNICKRIHHVNNRATILTVILRPVCQMSSKSPTSLAIRFYMLFERRCRR